MSRLWVLFVEHLLKSGLLAVFLVHFLEKHVVASLSHLIEMDLFGTIMDAHTLLVPLFLCLSFQSLQNHVLKHVPLFVYD